MRNILILFVCCAWFTGACGKKPQVEHGQPTTSSIEAKKERQEAADAVSTHVFKEKEEFRRQAEKTLEGYQTQIDKLKLKADHATGEARKRFNEYVKEWNKQKKALEKDLEEMEPGDATARENAEQRINAGMDELKKIYERARSAVA